MLVVKLLFQLFRLILSKVFFNAMLKIRIQVNNSDRLSVSSRTIPARGMTRFGR